MNKMEQFVIFMKMTRAFHLDAYSQIVYFHFLNRSNDKLNEGWFSFSVRELVRYTGIGSVNTVRAAIKNLIKRGLVQAQYHEKSVTYFRLIPLSSLTSIIPQKEEERKPEKLCDGIYIGVETFIHFGS